MDSNEKLKLVMAEVIKFSELKRALVLSKILRESPLIDEQHKINIESQLEEICHDLEMTYEELQEHLRDFENTKEEVHIHGHHQNQNKNQTMALPQSQRLSVNQSSTMAYPDQQPEFQDTQETKATKLTNEQQEEPLPSQDGSKNLRRFCLNKKCRYTYFAHKHLKNEGKDCVRCGSATIFII